MDVKEVQLDYLFLDNETCSRCKETETQLDAVIDEVEDFLKKAGKELLINKIKIETRKDAVTYQFEKSPTVLVNGVDLGFEQLETNCEDCGELCGCGEGITCRSWVMDGQEYEVPPKELLINRILSAVFSSKAVEAKTYALPENLITFFDGKEKVNEEKQCCDSTCCS